MTNDRRIIIVRAEPAGMAAATAVAARRLVQTSEYLAKATVLTAHAPNVGNDGMVHLPQFATDPTVDRFMEIVWERVPFYVEDFLALFLALRLTPGTAFVRKNFDPVSHTTPWIPMPLLVADEKAKGALRSPPYVPTAEAKSGSCVCPGCGSGGNSPASRRIGHTIPPPPTCLQELGRSEDSSDVSRDDGP